MTFDLCDADEEASPFGGLAPPVALTAHAAIPAQLQSSVNPSTDRSIDGVIEQAHDVPARLEELERRALPGQEGQQEAARRPGGGEAAARDVPSLEREQAHAHSHSLTHSLIHSFTHSHTPARV